MIRGYVGLLGEGKTLSMVKDTIPYLRKHKKVLSNLPIKIPDPQQKGEYLTSIYLPTRQLLKAFREEYNALFVIDEASIVFPAQYWNKLDPDFIIKFAQARKYGLDLFYTTQRYGHAIKRLRDLTNEIVICKKEVFFNMTFFKNWIMNPEYFDNLMRTEWWFKDNIINSRHILPKEAKELYKAYDTMFMVQGSELMETVDSNIEYGSIDRLYLQ